MKQVLIAVLMAIIIVLSGQSSEAADIWAYTDTNEVTAYVVSESVTVRHNPDGFSVTAKFIWQNDPIAYTNYIFERLNDNWHVIISGKDGGYSENWNATTMAIFYTAFEIYSTII